MFLNHKNVLFFNVPPVHLNHLKKTARVYKYSHFINDLEKKSLTTQGIHACRVCMSYYPPFSYSQHTFLTVWY